MTAATLFDLGKPTAPVPAVPSDPIAVPCSYRGFRYALPCRATPGEPCRDARGLAMVGYHAERRAAAGEHVPTYEERFGAEPAPEDEDDPSSEGSVEEEAGEA